MADAPLEPELHEELRRGIHATIRRRSLRRRAIGIAAMGVTALSLAGAAFVVLLPPEIRDRRATCYEAADLQSRNIVSQYGFDDQLPDPQGAAVENCTLLWETGLLENADVPTGEAPPLQLCRAQDSSFSVFPRSTADSPDNAAFCRALRLGPAE